MSWPGLLGDLRDRARLTATSIGDTPLFGAIMSSSLARNTYALMTSIVVSSALGILFWALAGRLFEQAVVGIGSVLINTATTISVSSRISLNIVLQRFLPGTGPGASRLVLGALLIGGTLGYLAAFAFALVAGRFMPDLAFLADSWTMIVFFATIVALWTVYSLLDSTFSALRVAHWVPVFSISSSLLKICAILVAASIAANATGLLAAWIVPLVPAVGVGCYLVFRVLLPQAAKGGRPLASVGTMARFCSFDYIASLAPTIAIAAAPLMVLSYAGPETTAQFYIGWLIAYSIYLMGYSTGVSLLAESVIAYERIASLTGQALAQAVLPIAGLAIAVAIFAPTIMAVFGPQYPVEGALILQILALSCIPWILEAIFLAVARARDWLPAILGIQWMNLTLVLVFGFILAPEMGGAGMALAWLLAHTLSVLVIIVGSVLTFGTSRTLNTSIILAGEFLRAVARLFPHVSRASRTTPSPIVEPDGRAQAHTPIPRAEQSTGANRIHDVLGEALLKLRATPPLADRTDIFPEAVALVQGDHHVNGTALIESAGTWRPSFADAVVVVAAIHAATARTQTPSARWLDRWISAPLTQLKQVKHGRETEIAASTLNQLESHMRAFWSKQQIAQGLTHYRLSSESLIFAPASALPQPMLSKVVGWSDMRADGPAGFDICHLGLTTRMRVRAQDLGPIVHDLLNGGGWSENERQWLSHDGAAGLWLHEHTLMREMIILVWVNHLAQDLSTNPAITGNRFWRRINLDWPLGQAKRYVMAK